MKDKIVEILKEHKHEILDWVHGICPLPDSEPFAEKIAHLYSAGEEVSDEEIEKELKRSILFLKTPKEINRIWAIGDHMAKWMRSKLTRPTVSEEEIMQLFIDSEEEFYKPEVERITKSIVELLNR